MMNDQTGKLRAFDWKLGWNIMPNDAQDVYKICDALANCAHADWLVAMKKHEVPAEDVSPGEGFLALKAKIIELTGIKQIEESAESEATDDIR